VGTSRVRMTVTAAHRASDIDRALEVFRQATRQPLGGQ
jgi:7-keto-8-aminopelargonate synthetase-like enzyme